MKQSNKGNNEMDEKYGKKCKSCGNRHFVFSTPGHNLPKNSYGCDMQQLKVKQSRKDVI